MSKYGHNKNKNGTEPWRSKDSKVVIGVDSFERVDLNPVAFDRLVKQKGTRVKVFRTTYCPNVKSVDSAEHEINCQLCNGSGFIDRHPIHTLATIQSQDLEKQSHLEGLVDGNSVASTFLVGIELQYMTLVELQDFTDIYIQRVLRNPNILIRKDVLKYTACKVNFVIDSTGKEYYIDTDYVIDRDGDLSWVLNRGPALGAVYSIHYEASVQFRAVKAMHVNRFTQRKVGVNTEFVKLNEQWLLEKEFLVRRRSKATGADLVQGPFDTHTIVED